VTLRSADSVASGLAAGQASSLAELLRY
jgi:hypothetical protein